MPSQTLIENDRTGNGCWKRIGVWGKEQPRCPLLEEVIHCRNCDVFTRAGRHLLDQDLTSDYRSEWTDVMAAKKEEELFHTISVVLFRIETEWLSLRSQVFKEIINPERLHMHSIPHRKTPVLIGLINVNGEIHLCISLKELLGIETDAAPRKDERKTYRRMMMMQGDNEVWVFPVNEIYGIHRVHPGTFQNVPVTVAKAQSTFTKGIFKWKKKHVAFLDDELLLFSLARSVQ